MISGKKIKAHDIRKKDQRTQYQGKKDQGTRSRQAFKAHDIEAHDQSTLSKHTMYDE